MKRYSLVPAMALLVACSVITEPACGCSPPGGGTAVITGTVTDPAMAPVEGAAVRLRVVRDETCEEPDTTITTTVQSGASGRFRHSASWSGGRKCFRLWAEPPQGSALSASESRFVRVDYQAGADPDSVELAFQLR